MQEGTSHNTDVFKRTQTTINRHQITRFSIKLCMDFFDTNGLSTVNQDVDYGDTGLGDS